MRSISLSVTLLVATITLTACGYVPLSTASKMARFNPLEADPAGLVVTLGLPEEVGLVAGSEKLGLHATNGADGTVSRATYTLARRDLPGGDLSYRIAPEDLADLTAQQVMIAGWEEAMPRKTTGGLSLAVTPCKIGEGPSRRARLSATISELGMTEPMTLFRGLPVRRLLPNGTSDLPPCA